jgi:hypothetical protein
MILASIKPQLSLLPFIWLCIWYPGLLYRSITTVGLAVAVTLAMAWDPNVIAGMARSIELYLQIPFVQPEHGTAIYRWFGRGAVVWAAPLVAVLVTVVLAAVSRRTTPATLAIPVLVTALLMPVKGYDLTILMIPFFLMIAISWSWLYFPGLVLGLRPNALGWILEKMHWVDSKTMVVYTQWLAFALCLIVLLWTYRNQFGRIARDLRRYSACPSARL